MNSLRNKRPSLWCKFFLLFIGTLHLIYFFLHQKHTKTYDNERWMQDIYDNNASTDTMIVQRMVDVAKHYHTGIGLRKPSSANEVINTQIKNSEKFELEDRHLESDIWQEVLPSSDGRLLVYSAYYDDRQKLPLIRVMAAMLRNRTKPVYCVLYSKDEKFISQTKAQLNKLPEHHGYNYLAVQILCSIPPNYRTVPGWVAISELNITSYRATVLPVHYYKNHTSASFAVCVKPIHSEYDRALWLVEFFEMHRVLGVEHFYMYIDKIGPNIRKVLDSYKQTNVITELVWNLELKSQREIHTEGIMVSLNDCLYRTMHRYSYTVMVDLDEYIIPTMPNKTYSQLLTQIQLKNSGCFIFQNFFFFLYWKNDTNVLIHFKESLTQLSSNDINNTNLTLQDLPYLLTVFKTKRMQKAYPFNDRSKFIVRPETAIVVGNHFIHNYMPGYLGVNVPKTIASIHHYRQLCTDDGYECIAQPSTTDRTAWSYSGNLIRRVFQECKRAFPENKMCPVAPPLQGPPY